MDHATTAPPRGTAWSRKGSALRRWGFGGFAVAWFAVSTFAPLDLPNSAVVLVLGLLVMLSVEPDTRRPTRGVAATGRNLVLAILTIAAAVPVAAGMDLLLGRVPIEAGHVLLATSAALAVFLPRLAKTAEYARPAVLGHRELIISVAALVAFLRMYQAGEVFVAMVAFAIVAPIVMVIRRARLGTGRLAGRTPVLQARNFWLFLALLGAASLVGTFFVWRVFAPAAYGLVVGAFWAGLVATAVLVAFPRSRVSAAANVLVALGSVFLAAQLVAVSSGPTNPVTIGFPSTEEWQVASGGRSTLVNGHWSLTVQQNAIDLVQLVDGTTYRGDRSRLENFHIFGDPVLAVADGRVTAAVDAHSDAPVGGNTWQNMAGNHVLLDIGGGRHVLYAHLKQGTVRVRAGDQVRRGQTVGQVGDSGNSDEPHLHIQVQNAPTFDVEDRGIRTYPILFEGATVADLRRGDSVRPSAPATP